MSDSFWWHIRARWLLYIVSFSFIIGLILTFIITVSSWVMSGDMSFDSDKLSALYTVASFWFSLAWVISFLLAHIFSFKYIFNKNIAGKSLYIMDCESKEPLTPVILLDVLPVWRKFLFLIVWILLVVALLLLGVFGMDKSFFGGSTLFILILLIGVVMLKPLLLSVKNVRRSDDIRLLNPKGKK
jgi:hypothetical protein